MNHSEFYKPKREAVGVEYHVVLEPHVPINLFALLLFLYTTGRRVSEAINLRTSDVDLKAAIASIEKTKTETQPRRVWFLALETFCEISHFVTFVCLDTQTAALFMRLLNVLAAKRG